VEAPRRSEAARDCSNRSSRLAACRRQPRINLVLHQGVLAPHSRWRALAVAHGRDTLAPLGPGAAVGCGTVAPPVPPSAPWSAGGPEASSAPQRSPVVTIGGRHDSSSALLPAAPRAPAGVRGERREDGTAALGRLGLRGPAAHRSAPRLARRVPPPRGGRPGRARSPRWADPVDGRVYDPARSVLSGVSMLGLPAPRREAARAARPCNRDLLGAFRRPVSRGRPFWRSRDTAAEWVKVPWTDGTDRQRVAKWGGATTRSRS